MSRSKISSGNLQNPKQECYALEHVAICTVFKFQGLSLSVSNACPMERIGALDLAKLSSKTGVETGSHSQFWRTSCFYRFTADCVYYLLTANGKHIMSWTAVRLLAVNVKMVSIIVKRVGMFQSSPVATSSRERRWRRYLWALLRQLLKGNTREANDYRKQQSNAARTNGRGNRPYCFRTYGQIYRLFSPLYPNEARIKPGVYDRSNAMIGRDAATS